MDGRKPKAVIVISGNASSRVESSAKILREYIERATKAKLPLNIFSGWFSKRSRIKIWVGRSKYVNKLKYDLDKLDEDGFVIAFPDKKNKYETVKRI